jgi:phosphoribosylformylglycinamidine synthase subunit PurQ / glutaminase
MTAPAPASQPRPRIGVITFPGSNDDGDARLALDRLGAQAVPVWHADRELPDVQAVVLPGGFSYGDYLRAGAIARVAPVMGAVRELAAEGGLVLGICNGFQILCESDLLPGVLRPNQSLSFVCRDVPVRVERADTPFTRGCTEGQRLTVPVKHGEGCFFADAALVEELEAARQVVLRYEGESPNGSVAGIAGIVNRTGNVMGLMPHPEHAVDPLSGSTDGAFILGSLVDAARDALREAAAA